MERQTEEDERIKRWRVVNLGERKGLEKGILKIDAEAYRQAKIKCVVMRFMSSQDGRQRYMHHLYPDTFVYFTKNPKTIEIISDNSIYTAVFAEELGLPLYESSASPT